MRQPWASVVGCLVPSALMRYRLVASSIGLIFRGAGGCRQPRAGHWYSQRHSGACLHAIWFGDYINYKTMREE
ncbi:hypothetical protein F5B18DRAFT_595892 [Nemania serpens]|nr:hypothetical protein F5B18DRAFT_595892 [Nemania serpens]